MQVKFENIDMDFGKKNVLQDIDFTIPEGKLISILGPSGCGKSTTLMLISGLNFPSDGKIYFGDKEVTKMDAVKRKVGMVFQNYALYPHLNVLDNISFPLKMEKMGKTERRERARELAQLVKIEDHIDKKPSQLSGGQQQRVAIARALAKKPSILLMDEPLSNLDARLRIEMREEIKRIQQKTGVTTVFVTHDQEEALSISDEVMVLNEGSIQQYSTPANLYSEPNNLFVAEFIGSPVINTFKKKDSILNLSSYPISREELEKIETIGIRAEDFRTTENSDRAILTGKVEFVERVGKDTTVHLLNENYEIVANDLNRAPNDDEVLNLTVDFNNIFFFDESGERIKIGGN